MSTIEDNIESIRVRLAELEPAVREANSLRSALRSLEDIKLKEEDPEAWRNRQVHRARRKSEAKQAYMSRNERIGQIKELLAKDPGMSMVDIAEELGVSSARISQLMKWIDNPAQSKLGDT